MATRWHKLARPEQIFFNEPWVRTDIFMAGRGSGKQLSLDTPIATPDGWKNMANIRVGDMVYACDGTPTEVTWISDISVPKQSYRVKFSDGTYLDACADHEWITWEHRDRKSYLRNGYDPMCLPERWWEWTHQEVDRWGNDRASQQEPVGPKTRTTEQIKKTALQGKRGDRNHSIPVTAPLVGQQKDLPIDPYLFGYWLGDGASKAGAITVHIDDCDDLTEKLVELGLNFRVTDASGRRHVNTVSIRGLSSSLNAIGVLRNKSVPEDYLWASVEQREALLAGLMDSDGYTDGKCVEFCSINRDLANAVYHLAASLGQKPVIAFGRARLYGKDCGEKMRVTWRPTRQPFRLNRKVRRAQSGLGQTNQAFRHTHRMIVDVEPIESVPMRCISVAHDSHTYLAGWNMIPTHNSRSAAEKLAEDCLTRPGLKAAILAPSYTAGWDTCLFGAKSGLLTLIPDKSLFETREKKYMVEFANGSSIRVFSSEQQTHMRGPEFHELWVDEMADLAHGMRAWKVIRPAVRLAHEDGIPARIMVTGTPEAKELVVYLCDQAEKDDNSYRLRTGRTIDNMGNLDQDTVQMLYDEYGGTRYHKEQLEGVLLREAANALWTMDTIGACQRQFQPITFETIAIGVDPAVSSDKNADETGIIAGGAFIDKYGLTKFPDKLCAAVLGDWSRRQSPLQWFRDLVKISEYYGATTWVYEKNLAGPLIRDVGQKVLDETGAAIKLVPVHASTSKQARAEPVAALYEAGRVIHMHDPRFPQANLDKLEAQCVRWEPTERKSPDRIDALVYLIKHLLKGGGGFSFIRAANTPWGKR